MIHPKHTFQKYAELLRSGNPVEWPQMPRPHVIGGHDMRLVEDLRNLEGLPTEDLETGLKKIQQERGWA